MSEPERGTAEWAADQLKRPFPAVDIRWKPGSITKDKTRAMALAYLTSRAVMERLDFVLGVAGWQDTYKCLPNNAVECTLSCRIAGEWVTKADVGGESEQPDEGDRMKAAYSDALKRAAVKFGIGRFLYELPRQWLPWDDQKRAFVTPPSLPDYVLPGKEPAPPPMPKMMTGAELAKVKEWASKLEAEVTDVDTMNAACRQMKGENLQRGPFKEALWNAALDFAKQQGWRWAPKQVKFVLGAEEAVA